MEKMIVLTGVLGSGKTTLGKMLCKKHNYFFINELVLDFEFPYNIKKEAVKGSISAARKIDEWFLDCDYKREKIANDIRCSKTVVMEGNHMTTLSYAYANDKASYDYLLSLYKKGKYNFVEPDMYAILKINTKTSISRQKERGDSSHPLWSDRKLNWNNKDFVKRYYAFFNRKILRIEKSKIIEIHTADNVENSFKNLENALTLL